MADPFQKAHVRDNFSSMNSFPEKDVRNAATSPPATASVPSHGDDRERRKEGERIPAWQEGQRPF